MASGDIILEYQRIGPVVKVTAVDPATLIEVTIQGPASWGEPALRRTALAKLHYVLVRKGLTKAESPQNADQRHSQGSIA